MKGIWRALKSFYSALNAERIRWVVTFIFIGLFVWSMYLESLRTLPAIEILFGAVTTNLPTVVVLFYAVVVLAHNFVNMTLVRGRQFVKFQANSEKKLSELKPKVPLVDDSAEIEAEGAIDVRLYEVKSGSERGSEES